MNLRDHAAAVTRGASGTFNVSVLPLRKWQHLTHWMTMNAP